jgi:uncharacterized membrane protein
MPWQKYGCLSPHSHSRCAAASFPPALDLSTLERATVESGREIFSPTRAIRLLASSVGIVFAILLIWFSYSVRRPEEWWVPYLFLVFLALIPFMCLNY